MSFTCIPNVGYFDTPDFLSLASHTVTIISTPIHLTGLYCLLMKTPDQMKSAKVYLLNLHFWIIMFDYSIGILTIPFFLFPVIAGHPLGVLRYLGVPTRFQSVCVCTLFGNLITSNVAVFENRFNTVCTFSWLRYWRKLRIGWLLLYYLWSMTLLILFSLFIPDQKPALEVMFKKLPCLSQSIYQADNFVLSLDYTYHVIVLSLIGLVALIKVSYFVICLAWNTVQQLKAKTMSQKTYQMQKKFFIALVTQMLVPFITIAVPCFYALYSVTAGYYNQALTNLAVIVFSTHGIVSTLVMLYVHKPYREAVLQLLKRSKIQESSRMNNLSKCNSQAPIQN